MIEPSPVRHHMTRRHDPVRLCDGQPADDDDIPTSDIDALRDARAEATLCPVCQQNSHIHDYILRPDRYQDGRRTLAHLYTVPVRYAFDGIRNCPHCRENPGARTCRAWKEARKSVRVLHREARHIAMEELFPFPLLPAVHQPGGFCGSLYGRLPQLLIHLFPDGLLQRGLVGRLPTEGLDAVLAEETV